MAFNWMLPLRIAQALFGLIVIALAAYVSNWYNTSTTTPSPSQVNFLMFCGAWSVGVVVPYLTLAPRFFPKAANKFAILGAEAVTMVFWFAGFIALAVFLSGLLFCRGNVCRAAQAATAFGGLSWLLFAVTTVLAAVHIMMTRAMTGKGGMPQMQSHSVV